MQICECRPVVRPLDHLFGNVQFRGLWRNKRILNNHIQLRKTTYIQNEISCYFSYIIIVTK